MCSAVCIWQCIIHTGAMCTVKFELCSTLCIVQCGGLLLIVQYNVHNVKFTVYNAGCRMQNIACSVQCAVRGIHFAV